MADFSYNLVNCSFAEAKIIVDFCRDLGFGGEFVYTYIDETNITIQAKRLAIEEVTRIGHDGSMRIYGMHITIPEEARPLFEVRCRGVFPIVDMII